jgi:diguanylate cyclase (GGDEF)-like protein
VVADMVDISKEMEAQQALEAREQLLRQLTQALPLGVFQVDVDRQVGYTNDRLYELVGPALSDALDDLGQWISEPALFRGAVEQVLSSGDSCEVEVKVDGLDDGPPRLCHLTVRPLTSGGVVTGAVGCVDDITEPTILRRELEDRATFDPLTRCHNRSAILTKLKSVLAEQAAIDAGTALLFVDLDDFKSVNDRFGHAVGDEFLAAAAARLRRGVRETATVGRQGGDEFLIVVPGLGSADEAVTLAERIAVVLSQQVALSVGVVEAGASVGVAFSSDSSVTADSLIALADAAMYEAKRQGGGRASLGCPPG